MGFALVVCFKQKTAYEMRIGDGSSDVCASDLMRDARCHSQAFLATVFGSAAAMAVIRSLLAFLGLLSGGGFTEGPLGEGAYLVPAIHLLLVAGDRKSVV